MNPAQREIIERLGSSAGARPSFDAGLRDELREELEDRLGPVASRVDEQDPLYLAKHAIESVHGCEARFVAERDRPFEWSAPLARGSVSHKAIELSVMRHDEAPPLDLVDDAIGSLMGSDRSLGEWLRTCGDTVRAEVRGEANVRVASFVECWPPLSPRWTPVLEGPMRAELCGGRVVLSGKPDLTLGSARGTTAGKVIVDFKTGVFSVAHVADLRFYALLDTLRIGTPPRMLATYYLDQGQLHVEEVTVDLLRAAVDRIVDAAGKVVTLLHDERDPLTQPGWGCRWCPLLADCADGTAHLRALDEHTDRLDDLP